MSAHPYDNDPGLAGRFRNTRTSRGLIPIVTYPVWAHPEVTYWADIWQSIRDCTLGEQEIKDKADIYLKPLDEMTADEYDAYLDRAVFFNMTGRTVSALTGIIFQRMPKVGGIDKKRETAFKLPTRDNLTFNAFLKKTCRELITMGRYGVLVDMDEKPKSGKTDQPYFTGYIAENILDWTMTKIDGRMVPTEIVLREVGEKPRAFGEKREQRVTVRRLALEFSESRQDWVYSQYIYEMTAVDIDIDTIDPKIVVPTKNGKPFNRIPFAFLGALENTADIDRSPLADIAALNISHYRSYAQLEHSRHYTAMPVWYAQVPQGQAERSYRVGSGTVWECAPGEKPGLLEMNGSGLTGLVTACEQKEDQISALGGRLMSGKTKAVAESDNSLRLKEGNERSILLNIVFCVNEGMTELLKFWAEWAGQDNTKDIEVELNTEFLTDTLGARELRAVYAMYVDGVVPLTVLHHYLQKAEVVPDWMDVDQFKGLLDDESEFKNQPDVIAKMKGFATAKDKVVKNQTNRQIRLAEKQADASVAVQDNQIRSTKVYEKLDAEKNDIAHRQVDVSQQQADQAVEIAKEQAKAKAKADADKAKLALKTAAARPAPAAKPKAQ
ncbi:DUF4055 domain-containing protein [Mesorhizobium sp. M8A.F.Ca.ET.021.01.1.1]|uniref:DUF4055 domain-containing protein n=1 Tax=Mesorhizobium sp. M8A.F.Ca.ET.021.01.1.1 TaxID=2496757 RepID=UPI000FCCC332|nr:DUF4055 domain-containing protein [Mesorhizobium sp. M8A.F.Ca.ET.021.01.1.1]RUW56727.1 DUF4055 domain-containing protein [Mesorhizobium sp. M8A.F.Ca.ET.021.01.1.1]